MKKRPTLGSAALLLPLLWAASCIGFKITELNVDIGGDGTDDNVFAKICSVRNPSRCCNTLTLESAWTNDWNRHDNEVWTGSWLGPCRNYNFVDEPSLKLIIKKDGRDDMTVDKVVIKTNRGSGRFVCPRIQLQRDAKVGSAICNVSNRWWREEEETTMFKKRKKKKLKKLKLKNKKSKKSKVAKAVKAAVVGSAAKKAVKTSLVSKVAKSAAKAAKKAVSSKKTSYSYGSSSGGYSSSGSKYKNSYKSSSSGGYKSSSSGGYRSSGGGRSSGGRGRG